MKVEKVNRVKSDNLNEKRVKVENNENIENIERKVKVKSDNLNEKKIWEEYLKWAERESAVHQIESESESDDTEKENTDQSESAESENSETDTESTEKEKIFSTNPEILFKSQFNLNLKETKDLNILINTMPFIDEQNLLKSEYKAIEISIDQEEDHHSEECVGVVVSFEHRIIGGKKRQKRNGILNTQITSKLSENCTVISLVCLITIDWKSAHAILKKTFTGNDTLIYLSCSERDEVLNYLKCGGAVTEIVELDDVELVRLDCERVREIIECEWISVFQQ